MHLICFTAISFPGFTISKKWIRIFLKPSSQIRLTSLYLHWLFLGRKISYSSFVSSTWQKRFQLHHQNLPGTSLKAYVGQRYCKSLLVFPYWVNWSSTTQTLQLFFCCATANSYLIGSCCSYSHLVFSRDLLMTIYCSLDDNTCIFTGMPFYFQLLCPSCPSIFHSLNKVSWFSGRRCHVKRC